MKSSPAILLLAWFCYPQAGICQNPATRASGGEDPVEEATRGLTEKVTQGALRVAQNDGAIVECPLKHTDVQVEISGFIARVKVTQTFFNPFEEKIEAVYVFPLPHESAVDDMTMVVGERRIVGVIQRRDEARRIYEEALLAGQTAALLEQERPNIFTQSVGNIKPKQVVRIEIGYVDVLEYDQGHYEFHFPMVVGPRYIPGAPTSGKAPVPPELSGKVAEVDTPEGADQPKGTGWSPDTEDVPDASRITPPVLKPGVRNGHDISLAVKLDAGVPIHGLKSINHQANIQSTGASTARAELSSADSVPNKDFVLRYGVMGKEAEMALLCHTDGDTGYFLMMIQPREDEKLAKTPPREIVFMVDVSGSMSGKPIAKCREAMEKFLGLVRAKDTVQVITFAGRAQKLFEEPVPASESNIERALGFAQRLQGGGGTEMLKGVHMAINEPIDRERMRIVVMLTDGYIGNEAQIIEAVGKACGDQIRFWCLGVGKSVNRFLVDGVARQGGGMGKVLSLNEDSGALVEEFMTRIQRAQLSRIKIDWGGMETAEVYPARVPELWAGRPVVLFGLYRLSSGGKTHKITVSGLVEGEPVSWPLEISLPSRAEENLALSRVWARQKIEELMHETYYAGSPEIEDEVTAIALEYRLMSQYTSFVAVDESEIPEILAAPRPPRRLLVPVPMPEDVSFEGVFGGGHYESADSTWGYYRGLDSKAKRGGVTLYNAMGRAAGKSASPRPMSRPMLAAGSLPSRVSAELRGRANTYPRGPGRGLSGQAGLSRRLRSRYVASSAYGARSSITESLGEESYEPYLQRQALAAHYQEIQKRVPEVLESARQLRKDGQLLAARERFLQAYVLDAALVNAGRSAGGARDEALSLIQETNQDLVRTWSKDLPALGRKLDLVIRDKGVAEALAEVARATGLRLEGLEGSVGDTAALSGRAAVRVTYLDLRNAAASQALDWILHPARLSWQVVTDDSGRAVRWGSSRRQPAIESAWVYDVGHLALPTDDELAKEKDRQKWAGILRQTQEEFLASVKTALRADDKAVAWCGPGRLLLLASREGHSAGARLFESLADPNAPVDADLKALQKLASARAGKRKEALAKRSAARERVETLATLDRHSLPLLSAAAAGTLDDEALTELEIAWRSPQAETLTREAGSLSAVRSAWVVSETARALPENPRVRALSELALKLAKRAADKALETLETSPEGTGTWFQVLYSALAYRENAEFLERARKALVDAGSPASRLAVARSFAKALLAPSAAVDAEAVVSAFKERNAGRPQAEYAAGDDLLLLTALACRRAGIEPWDAFRREARHILGSQPLSGSLVVFVNRLSRLDLALLERNRE